MTTPEQFKRIEELFNRAVGLPKDARAAFLDQRCADDPEVRRQVEAMLADHDRAGDAMSPGLRSVLQPAAGDPAKPGDRIGPYTLTRRIGEGGMGVVFEAEQEEPVRRKVALKLIKWGMDTRQVVARFEAERQALAMMTHPGIARVLDAGATEEGRPYFVMELVDGKPIHEYCDAGRLDTAARLALFRDVCAAVQHAHQKGVIHRDLKPANVLIAEEDGRPQPKVIDFGIAKAIEKPLTERSVFTELGQLIGTPEYMSPEQASGADDAVDTRTDVYALGIVLYQLLTGALPLDPERLRQGGFEEILRRIRETEPPLPSARRREPSSLMRELRGDLDWIVMKALEKEPARRYDSVSELAADIERHLKSEPVSAGPPSASYRARKFLRRHRVGVAAASLVLIAIVAGGALATVGFLRAAKESRARALEAETARQVSEFLVELFEVSAPGDRKPSSMTAIEILEQGAARIDEDLADQPLVRARMLTVLGEVHRQLGQLDEARPLLEQSLEIREERLPADHPDVATTLFELAVLLREMDAYDEARPHFERAAEIRRAAFGPDDPSVAQVLGNLGRLEQDTGEYDAARERYGESVAILERHAESEPKKLAATLHRMAVLERELGNYDESRALFDRVLEIERAHYGNIHHQIGQTLGSLGALCSESGDYDCARETLAEALAIFEEVLEPDHLDIAKLLGILGDVATYTGDYEQARAYQERALTIKERVLDPEHTDVAISLINLGNLLVSMEEYDDARGRFEASKAIFEKQLGAEHVYVSYPVSGLGDVAAEAGDHSTARRHYELALALRESSFGADHPVTSLSRVNLGTTWLELGDGKRAAEMCGAAVTALREAVEPDHPYLAAALHGQARALAATGELERADTTFEQSIAMLTETQGEDNPNVAEALEHHASLLRRMGREGDALAAEERAAGIRSRLAS